ncbi:MAG TPA: creatinine amidohydrolase [Planctomycetaceae bacterium]|nr:creatinine amidohydrolase [Planctomycetaceae bacterium]
MRYELMLPDQIHRAIDENWPVVLPIGVLEYHAQHLALGVDTLVVLRSLELLEQERDLVIMPPFYYGAASYAVEKAERSGAIHVDCEQIIPLAKGLFMSLLKVGFRNIHGVVHHQTENFDVGMPTDLAFKTAARKTIFDFIESQQGEGWWGAADMSDYYDQNAEGSDPFSWIRLHALMDPQTQQDYTFDHAGIGETSLMMSLCPEGVDMTKFSDDHWYAQSAKKSSKEYGDTAKESILNHLRQSLKA